MSLPLSAGYLAVCMYALIMSLVDGFLCSSAYLVDGDLSSCMLACLANIILTLYLEQDPKAEKIDFDQKLILWFRCQQAPSIMFVALAWCLRRGLVSCRRRPVLDSSSPRSSLCS